MIRQKTEEYNKIIKEYTHLKNKILKNSKPALVKKITRVMAQIAPFLPAINMYKIEVASGLEKKNLEKIKETEENLQAVKTSLMEKIQFIFKKYLDADTEIEKIGCILFI